MKTLIYKGVVIRVWLTRGNYDCWMFSVSKGRKTHNYVGLKNYMDSAEEAMELAKVMAELVINNIKHSHIGR